MVLVLIPVYVMNVKPSSAFCVYAYTHIEIVRNFIEKLINQQIEVYIELP